MFLESERKQGRTGVDPGPGPRPMERRDKEAERVHGENSEGSSSKSTETQKGNSETYSNPSTTAQGWDMRDA